MEIGRASCRERVSTSAGSAAVTGKTIAERGGPSGTDIEKIAPALLFQGEDGIRDHCVAGVQTCALPISVFIDGCFWHSCPIHCVRPSANAEWWRQKLARNARRDRDTSEKLEILGWRSEERRVGKECRRRRDRRR